MKKFIFSAAILGLVAPIALATTSASADAPMTTSANVSFTGIQPFPAPVNPDNPSEPSNSDQNAPTDQPANPDENSTDTTKGNLRLITAPSFNFGPVNLSTFTSSGLQNIQVSSLRDNNGLYYVQVGDNRSAGATGWSLTAKLGTFTKDSKSLPTGTSLTLPVPTIKNSTENDPTASQVSPNYTSQNLVLTSSDNSAKTIATATSGHGYGVTSINWSRSGVMLNLPNGVQNVAISGESYTAPITWTLAATQATSSN